MGRTLYAYGDKLWEVSQRFEPTNGARQFTLQPGEYLFMCYGGAGGGTSPTGHWGYGGAAYGIFETDREETLYAVVGGNGEAYDGTTNLHQGGFNGGGNGGTSTLGKPSGGGGGGASDIRLNLDATEVPPLYENNLPSEYEEYAFLHLRFTDDGYFDTGYAPRANSRLEMDVWFHAWSSERNTGWRCPYGCRSSDYNRNSWGFAVRSSDDLRVRGASYNTWEYTPDNDIMLYNRKIHLVHNDENHRITWTDGVNSNYIQLKEEPVDCPYSLYMFTFNDWGSAGSYYPYGMRLYNLKIYEGDTLVRNFIPCKRISDSVIGMYDKVTETFRAVTNYLYGMPKETTTRTLLSRIIVASGGGGNAKFSTDYGMLKSYYGGGERGGWASPTNSAFYDITEYMYADQSTQPADSEAKFGKGADGRKRSQSPAYGAEGAGGGGGGWYGGYSLANWTAEYSSIGGSGGSSYALTATSYKPYGYIPDSHYYLHDTALVGCQSSEGEILVCVPVKALLAGDKIISPLTGKPTKIRLYPGTYDVKCWGGEGEAHTQTAYRYNGGYSEGRLTLDLPHDVYAVVGGSGYFYDARPTDRCPGGHNPLSGYNGGGGEVRKQLLYQSAMKLFRGGGATDLRLTMDDTPVHPPIPDPDTRDDIPEGYTQLKAIVSTTHFDPGYIRKANSGFFIDMSTRDNLSGYEVLFGNGNDGSSRNYYFYTNPPSRNYVAHWQVTVTEANGTKKLPSQTRVKITVTPTTLTWVSDTDSETLTIPEGSVQDGNMSMFFGSGRNGYGTEGGDIAGTWYAIKISEGGTMVHDFVPCKNNSNNQIGWYDVITDTFYQWGNSSVPLSTYNYPSRSLLSRIIVAGGGGGQGYSSGFPGKGGGASGGSPENGYGTNAGPGTQTASPQNLTYPEINGGFGYGGSGVIAGGGRGGSGGGGWFGGSGTYPDGSNDNDKGGAGGSGYVLTSDSYKPEYYIPTSEFYMSNAVTTLGGNTLTPNMTKIEIDVIEAFCNKLLMYDTEGYKTYDEDQDKWIAFSQTINPSLIEEYGRYDIPNINGMLSEFQVVVDDPDDALTNIEVSSIPLPQSIVFLVPRRYSIGRTIIDAVYDTSIYDFSTNVSIYDDQYNAYTVTIDKTQESDEVLKLYSIMLFSQ
jgi:hypothetical protein